MEYVILKYLGNIYIYRALYIYDTLPFFFLLSLFSNSTLGDSYISRLSIRKNFLCFLVVFPLGWIALWCSSFHVVMAVVPSSPLFQTIVYAGITYCLYHLYRNFTKVASHRRLSKEHGCEPVKKVVTKDPVFGLDEVMTGLAKLKEHKALESTQLQFANLKTNTFQVSVFRQPIVVTMEPEILKTILAVNFKSWGIPDDRKKFLSLLVGEGIFTTDGASWQHSRDMLRPNFVRSQIGDLPMFETHVQQLIAAIPCDGSTVDLQSLFYRLSLDIATEFLFGESSNSLAPDVSNESYTEFVKNFDYCQNPVFSLWWLLLPNWHYKRECRRVHGMYSVVFICTRGFNLRVQPPRKSILGGD